MALHFAASLSSSLVLGPKPSVKLTTLTALGLRPLPDEVLLIKHDSNCGKG